MAAKLSKKELKQPDAFQSSIEIIQDYIAENEKRFYAIVAAIVVATFIAFGIFMYWSHYQASASEMYAKAERNLAQNIVTPDDAMRNIKIYQELIDKYPHSWSARMAHYHLGNLYYNLGDYDKAIADYNKFVSSRISAHAGIKFLALTSLGYCYEAKKDYKSALEYYEKAQKSDNTGFESIGYRNIGRVYELQNDRKNALENYKKALDKATDPAMVSFIKYKISSLS
ncbi:MAG TPA: tetratricopeptide repeat protein [Smithella sp.]|nr:tetratricopeptide repeat protein [Smithella sp.]